MSENVQQIGFDNDGHLVVRNRKYRRQRIQLEIDPKNLPKKTRKKKSKKNYLNKHKK